jgi:cytochrome oxidase Cu insertion factor (SCO1/SenC/PrrC family)
LTKSKLRAQRGRSDPERELRRFIAAYAEDEWRSRFGDADTAIQAGQEKAAHQQQESVGVSQK